MIGIYKITSPTGKVYIGQSTNIERRFKEYKSLRCKGQIVLHRSFLKHGFDKHTFEVLEYCDILELNDKERYYQDLYSVLKNGLNCKLTTTSDRAGYISEETRLNMSIAMKKRKLTPEQLLAGTKRLIASNKKRAGIPLKESTKIKLRLANIGTTCVKRQGFNHPNSKIVLCLNTGIFYGSAKHASIAYGIGYSYLKNRLSNKKENKTNLIYI